MITWLVEEIAQYRSAKAIASMVGGLLNTADDWKRTTQSTPRLSGLTIEYTSEALKASIRYTENFYCFDGTIRKDVVLVLDGVEQPLPRRCWDKVVKLVDKNQTKLARFRTTDKLAETETKVAQWVVQNHRRIEKVELARTYAGEPLVLPAPAPAPKELRGGQLVVLPDGPRSSAPVGHFWCDKRITAYEPGPDWYRLEDGTTVNANEVRQALLVAA